MSNLINTDILKYTRIKFLDDIKYFDQKLSKTPNDIDTLNNNCLMCTRSIRTRHRVLQ